MRTSRYGRIAAVVVTGTLALAACGSDNNSPSTATGSTPTNGSSSAAGGSDCGSGSLQVAGSSAQKPAMTAWIDAYQQKCAEAAVNYDAQGSGNGRTQFTQGQVAFAGSDSALKPEEQADADKRCSGGKAVDLPMVATPVAFVYNVTGVDKLTVTPDALAQIFSGKITKWNDAALAKANPDVTLPATTITPVHRSKDSGTTENFTKFLDAQAKSSWSFGSGQAWKAPGGIGGADSAALVQTVKSTDGAIGYVDGPDATKNSLTPAALDVGNGAVEISKDSVGKALDAAETTVDGQDIKVAINYGLTDAGAYPAILVTYEIACTKGLPADQATLTKSFLTYVSSSEGQAALEPLGHLPLPDSLVTKVRASVAALAG